METALGEGKETHLSLSQDHLQVLPFLPSPAEAADDLNLI